MPVFRRMVLAVGLRGGVIGSVLALACLIALSLLGGDMAPGMLPGLRLEAIDWVVLVLLTPLVATVAAVTARSTVLSALARLI